MRLIALATALTDIEAAALALAKACSLTAAEARMRLQAGPPYLVARLADEAATHALEVLRAAGLPAYEVLEPLPDSKHWLMARELAFGPTELHVTPRSGPPQDLAYADLALLLVGFRVARSSDEKTTTTKKFALGMAIATQGLKMTRTETKTVRTDTEKAEQELRVVTRDGRHAILTEGGIAFGCLGAEVQPARIANFQLVVRKIRERASGARFDDRLLRLGRRSPTVTVPSPEGGASDALDVWSALVEVGATRGFL